MKGYNYRQQCNSDKAQRIAANRERNRKAQEELRNTNVAEAKEILRILKAHPNARVETKYGIVPNLAAKIICEKYLKDNGEEI